MDIKIPFNRPAVIGSELKYIQDVLKDKRLAGDGAFTKLCHRLLEERTGCSKALLTTSCTQALEMSAILADIKQGDEVIMASYTFVSTANAFVLRGAKIVFVDIRPDTLNIDEKLIEDAITDKTKAIVPVHYAGISCEMDVINKIARKHNLIVVEDAAQGIECSYKGKQLGTIGQMGCYSFHETKNINCGEGGALLINNSRFSERAEIIRQKGTDRSKFLLGQVDKYTWQDIGSSYLPSELNAAFLLAQMEASDQIIKDRIDSWNHYYENLKALSVKGLIDLPSVPEACSHNGHMFYIKVADELERSKLMGYLLQRGIQAVSHYVPLHSSKGGMQYGRFHGEDHYTTKESSRLLRLPIYYQIKKTELDYIVETVFSYFKR